MKSAKRQLLIALGCVIRDDQVLLTQRSEPEQADLNMSWELPGGKVSANETPEQAVLREVWEETGHEVEIADRRPFAYTTPYWRYADGQQRALLVCYECSPSPNPDARPAPPDHRIRAVKWFRISEIDPSRVLGGSREMIWWIAERRGAVQHLELQKAQPSFIHFEYVDHHGGSRKFYLLTVTVDSSALPTYRLHRTWGRIGQTPKHISEIYETDAHVRRRLLELANQRIAHGYEVTTASDNFPLKDWLQQHPARTPTPATQLALWN